LWKRWKALYFKLKNWKENFEVEYFPSITKETVLNEAKIAFKKCFWIDIQSNDTIILKPKESLSWWIRIYVDDKTLDLSYRRIEKALEK
jgi:hypothetical protein